MESGVVDEIRERGGEIYAISSEPQALAGRAKSEWALNFDTIGDPHHEIMGTCRDRDWLDIYANTEEAFLNTPVKGMDFAVQHPKGYFQPGVLVLDHDGRVLYRWRSIPKHTNLGGAVERPTPDYVWAQVEQKLSERASERTDADLDNSPTLDAKSPPWPLFVGALLANGWFLKPVPFAYLPNGPTPGQRLKRAMRRLVGFVVVWIAAFVWLPTTPVAVGLAAWLAWITPKVVMVNRNFQDIKT